MRLIATIIGLILVIPLALSTSADAVAWSPNPHPYQVTDADQQNAEAGGFSDRISKVIPVQLPITLASSHGLQQALQQFSAQAPDAARAKDRPIVILEFDTGGRSTGAGSVFGACETIARFLTSAKMKRVQTIAYLKSDARRPNFTAAIEGHAVLVAIAADDIAMSASTTIGNADAGDDSIEPYIEQAYRAIAEQNLRKLPAEVVLSMLKKDRGLFRASTNKGIQYVDQEGLERLEAADETNDSQTLAAPGKTANLSGEQLAQFNLIEYLVQDKSDFARQLNLPVAALSADASEGKAWSALSVKMPDFLDDRSARWMIRSVIPAVNRRKANLLLLDFDRCEGDPNASVSLARFIAEVDSSNLRTVAVIRNSAKSGAALVALSCDQILMQSDATLGGFGSPEAPGDPPVGSIHPSRHRSYEQDARSIASAKEKDWSILMAMIDAETVVARYSSAESGQTRLLCETEHAELVDKQQWRMQGPLDTKTGISAVMATQNDIAAQKFDSFDEVKAYYQLAEEPTVLTKTETDRWVETLAGFLTSPGVPFFLLMMGFFCISTEMSSPGLGAPGFAGVLCFAAFFWSQFFNGNAEWFEILLFVVGVVFVIMEVFVIPGFGIFGIGGVAMIGISIVLAAQSFVIPQNFRQLEQLPYSLFPLLGAGFGLVGAAVILPRILPNTPFLRNIILSPPQREDLRLDGEGDPESVADYSHLSGSTGVTVTKLMPSGRAKFGDRVYDVITNGLVVDKGEKVKVIEAIANRIVVESLAD